MNMSAGARGSAKFRLGVITRWLPLVAFLAAAIYLWRADFGPEIRITSLSFLVAATGVQLLAFALRAWTFRETLARFQINIRAADATICIFKPILAKYIPGKIWLLVSTVGHLEKQGLPLGRATVVVAIFQLLLTISGLVVGALALVAFQIPGYGDEVRILLIILPMLLLAVLLGSGKIIRWGLRRFPKFEAATAGPDEFPSLSVPVLLSLFHWFVVGLSFYLFFRSIDVDAGWYPLLFQAMAINIGVLAVFVPGGLGVREAAMAAYLTLAGVPLSEGIVIAVASRFWFLGGEAIAFFVGLWIDRKRLSADET